MTAMARPATERRPPSGTAVAVAAQVPGQASEKGWPSDPKWLRAARRRASAWVETNGFPTTKHEDWRYTKLDAALAVPLAGPLDGAADDVACSHGAAVGQLDPDALFYLRSRGVSEREARAVLVSGFAHEILERFGSGPIRRRAEELATAAGLIVLDEDGRSSGAVTAATTRARRGGRPQ